MLKSDAIYGFWSTTNRDSIRDRIVTLYAPKAKSDHLGLGTNVKLATLASPNIRRNYKLHEEFAYHLIDRTRRVCGCSGFEVKVDGNIGYSTNDNYSHSYNSLIAMFLTIRLNRHRRWEYRESM